MARPRSAKSAEERRARKHDVDDLRKRELSEGARDIGPIREIADVRRRSRCRFSLRKFCEAYNPAAFSLGWSADHLRALARLQEAVLRGALYAYAMPRGAGKSTLCRMTALWAVSYAHCRYVFAIGANAQKAQDGLAAIKTWMRFLPVWVDDFPEIAQAIVGPVKGPALNGVAIRAYGQLCGGEPTLIEWSAERVVLPTLPVPSNWPKSWPRRSDRKAPTSGAVVAASGLTGDGIRGSLLTLSTGELIRPDLVLLDDPQTSESAHSPSQNAGREQLISADVLGMAGPGKAISAVMPCTVIAEGDMVDRLLDRKLHPLWRGERTSMLPSMPADLAAWEPYLEIYRRCAQKEPPDYAEALAYYREHQARLEAGAVASWPERKLPWEVSAVQHAMHLWARDPRAFAAEYQNRPLPLEPSAPGELSADAVAARVSRLPRGTAPLASTTLVGMIDVQADLLYFVLAAFAPDFTGQVVDYGAWPDQRRAYYALREADPTLAQATGIGSLEGSLWAGLTALAAGLCGRGWPHEGGGELRLAQLLVDAGWGQSSELVRRFCRTSAHAAALLPSFGHGVTAAAQPMASWQRRPGERHGLNWVVRAPKTGEGRSVTFDANWWKSFAASRLGQPLGEKGALTLFGDRPEQHRLFAEHMTAEYRTETEGRGRTVHEWKQRAHRPDNHYFDCLTGCFVAASVQGVALAEMPAAARPERKRVSFTEMQRRARERRR